LQNGSAARGDQGLVAVLAGILGDGKLEPAFIALTLTPPSEADIAREIGSNVDPDAIHRARRALRAAIGEQLRPALTDTYHRLAASGPYRPDAAGTGRRALKNLCLDFLAANGQFDAIALALSQYRGADNMTDRMAALETLA